MHPSNIHPVFHRLVLHQQVKVLSPAPKPWRPFQLLTCLLQWTVRKNVTHEHCRALVHIHPTGLHVGREWLGWAPVPQPANTPFLPFFLFLFGGLQAARQHSVCYQRPLQHRDQDAEVPREGLCFGSQKQAAEGLPEGTLRGSWREAKPCSCRGQERLLQVQRR